MTCSARSLMSLLSSSASAASSSADVPRRRVPAIGCRTQCRPLTVTSASGDDPTMSNATVDDRAPPDSSARPWSSAGTRIRYMYGLGLVARRMRYTSSADAAHGAE